MIRACPPRELLFQQLGSPRERVESGLRVYLDAIDGQVGMLERAFREGKQ